VFIMRTESSLFLIMTFSCCVIINVYVFRSLWDSVARSLIFCAMFCRSMFVLLLSVIALTVLITASDYSFDIFKLFVNDINLDITYKFNRGDRH
jgi:hypothetical protein